MQVKKDTRYREYYSNIGNINIVYNISNPSDQEADSVSIRIDKDDKTIGNGTINRNGRMSMSIVESGDLSVLETKNVLDTIFEDVNSVFNPQILE
ncbi:MAG: hypothetical protein [Bacteriophage sp.]|jgi:hypothetical protein|nr:MAG: hypothetical protein [Bacteriophage sp.]